MNKKTARVLSPRLWLALALPLLVVLQILVVFPAPAQEQFFTQSGGRGLQNAKTNARLSKVEGDVDVLNVEMAKVKPHAKAELGSCPDSGDKLRWTGNNWVCDRETDPTVQGFAKKALPTCSGTSILGVSGGEFSCVQSGFVSNETDPTVQAFAKSPLPSCGQEQILTVSNGNLSCITDQKGLTRETDPMVHSFARTDTNPALPNCASNELLTMMNGNLVCKVDSVGITQEVDPFTASFARTDISGYTLAACGSGELLRSVVDSTTNKVILKCEAAGDALADAFALGDLSDVNTSAQASGTVLKFSGSEWVAASEDDPTVPGWAKSAISTCAAGEVLTYDGTNLSCVADAGGAASPLTFAGLDDVNVTGVADGQFVKYNLTSSKWVPATVQDFAQATLPTCTTGQVLTGDGTNLSCTNDAGSSGDPIDLVELGDVRTGPSTNLSPNTNDFLRYNAGTSKWEAVQDKLAGLTAGDDGKWCYYNNGTGRVVCDRGAPSQCAAGSTLYWNGTTNAFECADATTALGLGDMAMQNSNTVVIHGGNIDGTVIGGSAPAAGTFTNLRVTGNLYVSGSQSIDGVSFANGGVQATGTVTATSFVGDGSGLTGIDASSLAAVGNTGSVQYKGNGGEISGSGSFIYDAVNNTLKAPHIGLWGEGNSFPMGAYWDNASSVWRYNLSGQAGAAIRLGQQSASEGGDIQFQTAPVNGGAAGAIAAMTKRMVIKNTGNIGIGTAMPNAKLDVVGDISATNLRLSGNLYVSGTQSIDGVSFANGGVQATGTVTATSFVGDGSQLTGLSAANLQAAGISGSIQYRDAATGEIAGSSGLVWDEASKNVAVAGTVQMAGTGSESCGTTQRGQMRFVDIGGGDYRLQVCKP